MLSNSKLCLEKGFFFFLEKEDGLAYLSSLGPGLSLSFFASRSNAPERRSRFRPLTATVQIDQPHRPSDIGRFVIGIIPYISRSFFFFFPFLISNER